MARIKLQLPATFSFKTEIPVRISDLNYGNHLANHVYLEMMQEARMRYLAQFGYSEKDLAGVGVIMGDTAIVYKQECFYGDVLTIEVCASDFGARSFDLLYRFSKQDGSLVCEAKTGMVCFDYVQRTTVAVPEAFSSRAT
ncbi:MAG: thioesterase [Bacteroidetes bacterium B1(2017)]|nr:MAG: thioesterase [Bacteroidetes bacterium B1(2017)]